MTAWAEAVEPWLAAYAPEVSPRGALDLSPQQVEVRVAAGRWREDRRDDSLALVLSAISGKSVGEILNRGIRGAPPGT